MDEKSHQSFLEMVRDRLMGPLLGLAGNRPPVAAAGGDEPTGGEPVGADERREHYRNIEQTLRFIAQLGWTGTSDRFLAALAQYLGESLNVDYVVIDRLCEDPGVAETVALYAKGGIVPNIQYLLKGTPCENVMGKRMCYYPTGVQGLFPEDSLLTQMGVDSYAGIPLWDQSGKSLGLIALMDRNPLTDEEAVGQILQLVAVSAAAALEREQSDLLLHRQEEEFRLLAERYRLVFENTPISLWEEDFSDVKAFFDGLRAEGITDIERHFEQHPEAVRHCAELVKVIDVNRAAVALHDAPSKEELLSGLPKIFNKESYDSFRKELDCLWRGGKETSCESTVRTFSGGIRHVTLYFAVCPGYEHDLAKVLVSLADITDRKHAEDALMRLNVELELRVRKRTTEMEGKNVELARLNKLFVGRELKMVELKEKIVELKEKIRELEGLRP